MHALVMDGLVMATFRMCHRSWSGGDLSVSAGWMVGAGGSPKFEMGGEGSGVDETLQPTVLHYGMPP
jgi:hypothetical protein